MRKILYSGLALLLSATLFSQTVVNRALILNEGYYDYVSGTIATPVTIGAYDPVTGIYTTVNEVAGARFASDLKFDGDFYYVAADQYLLKYDRYTDALINTTTIPGIRKIAIDDSHIVVTRGEYLVPFDAYIQIYDKNTLALISEVPSTDENYTTEGVEIKDGIAYVAVNNGFDFGNEVGFIATVDMNSGALTGMINLGTDGVNPDNLMIDGDNIYTLNNKDFTGSSVSEYKISGADLTTTDLMNISSGCGTSAFVNGSVIYQEMFGTTLSKFDPITKTITDETDYGKSFYALAYNGVNDLLYASETDYFSYGKVNIYTASGILVNSFDVSVSPGTIAFDLRTATAVHNTDAVSVHVFPNPVANQLIISSGSPIRQINIQNLTGASVGTLSENGILSATVDMTAFPAGNYLVSIITDDATITRLIEKNN